MINFYNLTQQFDEQKDALQSAICSVGQSGQYFKNDQVAQFERTVSKLYNNANVVAVNSGTSALTIALKSANLPKHSLVAIPAMSYIATANSVFAAGLFPVCIDIDDNWHLNCNSLTNTLAACNRFSAVITVDLYGQGQDLIELRTICDHYKLKLFADAAQSFGMQYGAYFQSDLCDSIALSFNPLKNLGAMGNAGAVVSSNHSKQTLHHWAVQGKRNDNIVSQGFNCQIDAIQASILNIKFVKFADNMRRKAEIAAYYRDQLQYYTAMPGICKWSTHMNYVFVIAPKLSDKIKQALSDNHIEFASHYEKPLHHYDLLTSYIDSCPIASQLVGRCISLPNHWHLTDSEVEQVAQVVKTSLL